MTHRVAAAVLFASFFALPSVAQSNVTTCIPSFSWAIDAQGQTPCVLASQMRRACNIVLRYDSIPPGFHYEDPCSCSSAAYIMVSACGACQGRNWVNWPAWVSNCPVRFVNIGTGGSLPQGMELPRWAYVDVAQTANRTFDPVSARALAQTTQTVIPPAQTSSPTTTNGSPPPPPSVPDTTASLPAPSKSKSNAGAIAGGVVGGIVFLAAVGLAIFWFILKGQKKEVHILDLTANDDYKRPPSIVPPTPTPPRSPPPPPPMSMVSGSAPSPPPHARQYSSTSSESAKSLGPMNATVFALRHQKSADSLSLSTYTGHVSLVPSGYTGAAEPHGG